MLFYLLRDGKGLRDYLTKFIPNKLKEPVDKFCQDVNKQLSNYVRGRVTVAYYREAVCLLSSLRLRGLRYAVTLGIAAGILNLGSFLAMLPALVWA